MYVLLRMPRQIIRLSVLPLRIILQPSISYRYRQPQPISDCRPYYSVLLQVLPEKINRETVRLPAHNEKRVDRFRSGFVSLFKNLHGNREDCRTRIGHDIRVTHHVHKVFEIASGNVREPLVPAAKDQDMEPLDEQADERDHAIHPEDDADQDPVEDADEQFKTARILFECEELSFCVSAFGHTITGSAWAGVRNIIHGYMNRAHFAQLSALIFNNTRTDVIEHHPYEGSWSSWL